MHKVKIRGGRAKWEGRAPAHDVNDKAAAAAETETVRVKKGTYTPKQWVDPDGFPPLKTQSLGQFKNDDSDGGDDDGDDDGGGGGGGCGGDNEGNGGDGGNGDRRARGGPVPWWKCDAIDVAIMGPG